MVIKLYLKKTFNYQVSPKLDIIIKFYHQAGVKLDMMIKYVLKF